MLKGLSCLGLQPVHPAPPPTGNLPTSRVHSLVVIEAVLGGQVGADRRRILGALADDPGFTVKADLPKEAVGWDPV